MQTIAQRLKYLRKSKNLTLEEVGKHIGVGKSTIQKYENGIIGNIPSDKIEALAEILETTPAYIMGWTDSAESNEDSTESELNQTIVNLLFSLPESKKRQAIDYLRFLAAQEDNP